SVATCSIPPRWETPRQALLRRRGSWTIHAIPHDCAAATRAGLLGSRAAAGLEPSERCDEGGAEEPADRAAVVAGDDVLVGEDDVQPGGQRKRRAGAGRPATLGIIVRNAVEGGLAPGAIKHVARDPDAATEVVGQVRLDAEERRLRRHRAAERLPVG